MSRYKITVLTPLHISSGEEYELYYNFLEKDGYIYIYDEFEIVKFFVANNIVIPSNINALKQLMEKKSESIIDSGLHLRKIKNSFSRLDKPLLENISTANSPIVTGSSIKGSLRTAILDCLYQDLAQCEKIKDILKNGNLTIDRLDNRGRVPYDDDFATIFRYLKVTDALSPLETRVYKTINMKKERSHQGNRKNKVDEIANFVEAVVPGQSFEIEIEDVSERNIFDNLKWVINKFYTPFFLQDHKYYFSKKTEMVQRAEKANKDAFVFQVGRFGGAESKSLNNKRNIKASKAEDKSETTAKTFALDVPVNDSVYFEKQLVPFGWVMCEKVAGSRVKPSKFLEHRQKERFIAIDRLNDKKLEMEKKERAEFLKRKEREESEKKKIAEEKAKKDALLASMSPLERKIEELVDANPDKTHTRDVVIFNAVKSGELDEFGCEAVKLLKDEMIKLKKWVETTKNPQKDKKYKRTIEVIGLLEECE